MVIFKACGILKTQCELHRLLRSQDCLQACSVHTINFYLKLKWHFEGVLVKESVSKGACLPKLTGLLIYVALSPNRARKFFLLCYLQKTRSEGWEGEMMSSSG